MSAHTLPPPPPGAASTLDVAGTPRTPFGRLVAVEWRKMLDTRGGRWLFISVVAILGLSSLIVVLVSAFNDAMPVTAGGMMSLYSYLMLLLLPLFAILTVTSEWSQRTALTSFVLEPHRARVIGAKWVAVTLLAVATLGVAVLLGAVVTMTTGAIGGPLAGEWGLEVSGLLWTLLIQMLWFWFAFGLAMVTLHTPGSIAVFYFLALVTPFILLPILIGIMEAAGNQGVVDAMPWLHLFYATAPVQDGSGWDGDGVQTVDRVRFFVTGAWWVGLPVALGMWRILRAEVK